MAARLRELGRVGEQVQEHALDPLQVAPDHRGRGLDPQRKLDALALRQGLHLRDQGAQILGEVVLGDLQAQLRLLHPREVEQIADHLQQLEAAAEHRLERPPVRGGQFPHLALQDQLQRREHHRQRRLELVGDVGEELRLEAVERLELLVGSLQGGLGLFQSHLVEHLLAERAVEDDLAGAAHHGDAEKEGEVGERLRERLPFADQQVGEDEGEHDQRVGRDHYLGRPDEEQSGADDHERQARVVGRGEPAQEDGHGADAEGDQRHVRAGERARMPLEETGPNDGKRGVGDHQHREAHAPEDPEGARGREHVVENAEERQQRAGDVQARARPSPIALQQPARPTLLERCRQCVHQSRKISTNGFTPLSSSRMLKRAPGAALLARSRSCWRVR